MIIAPSPHTIRSRILKEPPMLISLHYTNTFTAHDPFEDTESSSGIIYPEPHLTFTAHDPFEDTESSGDSKHLYSQVSLHRTRSVRGY